jgi:predicted metal-dependent enzyme (double-stranded beta helix superfamily)
MSSAPPIALRTVDAHDSRGLAEWYAAHRAGWAVTPRFDPDRRWYARLAADAGHEAWLLTWLPGQQTDLHDHGGSAGAFTIIEGRLTEQLPIGHADVRFVERGYGAGATRPFGPRHVHRIVNAGPAPAVSLHVYAPALTRMTRYTVDGGRLTVTAIEREGADW